MSDKAFFFKDGSKAEDLGELLTLLKTLPREVTSIHVSENHNHYAEWVEYVLGKKSLADDMRKKSSVDEQIEVIEEHLVPAKTIDSAVKDALLNVKNPIGYMPKPQGNIHENNKSTSYEEKIGENLKKVNVEVPEIKTPPLPPIEQNDSSVLGYAIGIITTLILALMVYLLFKYTI